MDSTKRQACVFTIVQADAEMATLWHRFYRRTFPERDIYMLDHLTDGLGCCDELAGRCNVVRLDHPFTFDHDWLVQRVAEWQARLLSEYEKVLFAEVDEFVVPDPKCRLELDEYIGKFKGEVARVTGYNVLQTGGEPPLSLDTCHVLRQRSHWVRDPRFDKPLLASRRLEYTPGFHGAAGVGDEVRDPHLVMIHLKWACYDRLMRQNQAICARKWPEFDWCSARGREHRLITLQENEAYVAEMGTPALIPERFLSLL